MDVKWIFDFVQPLHRSVEVGSDEGSFETTVGALAEVSSLLVAALGCPAFLPMNNRDNYLTFHHN